jgi:hypothetical protein
LLRDLQVQPLYLDSLDLHLSLLRFCVNLGSELIMGSESKLPTGLQCA